MQTIFKPDHMQEFSELKILLSNFLKDINKKYHILIERIFNIAMSKNLIPN